MKTTCYIKFLHFFNTYLSDGDIFDQMDICRNKVNQLMKEVESKKELQQVSIEGIITTEVGPRSYICNHHRSGSKVKL